MEATLYLQKIDLYGQAMECACYRPLGNLDGFKTMDVTSDMVQLALDAKTLGCRNHVPELDLQHPTYGHGLSVQDSRI